jgi:hypothetical protein
MKLMLIQSDIETLTTICNNPGEYIEHFKLISDLGNPFYWQQWDYSDGFLYARLHQESIMPDDILKVYEYWQLWDNQHPIRILDPAELPYTIPGAKDNNFVGVREFVDLKHFISTFRDSNTETQDDIEDLMQKLYRNPETTHPHAPSIQEIADSMDEE